MKRLIAALIFVVAQTGMAPAATMTFDNFAPAVSANFSTKTYSEDGITATGNGLLADSLLRGADSLYMADAGWGGPTRMIFTMASAFNALSFDLTPSIFEYFVTNTLTGATTRSSYVNVSIKGYSADGLVASTSFDMGSVQSVTTYLLGAAFSNLTSLVIGFEQSPKFGPQVPVGQNLMGSCTNVPCSRYRIDNISLAPVPLPAGLVLMLTALAAGGFVASRKKATLAV